MLNKICTWTAKSAPYPPCTVTAFWLKYQDPARMLRRVTQPPHIAGPLGVIKSNRNMIISDNTIYYFTSTIAQVLAATSALLAIFIQFRINEVKKFLIGEGSSVYRRKLDNHKGYEILGKLHIFRLSDSIGREDIDGIEEIIKVLRDNEINEGYTIETRQTGFQVLYDRFINNKVYLKELRNTIKKPIFLSLITITLSISIILFTDVLKDYKILTLVILISLLVITILSIYFTFIGITEGLRDRNLKNNNA